MYYILIFAEKIIWRFQDCTLLSERSIEALEMHFPLTKAIVQYEQCMLSYLDFNNKYDTINN